MLLKDLIIHIASYDAAKLFLRHHCILQREIPLCVDCRQPMTEVKVGRGDEQMWRCPKHKTNKISLRVGSFLSNHNISFQDFVAISYCWSHQISVATSTEMVGLSKTSIIQWFSYLRDVCSHKLLLEPSTIGGEGHLVQIDESLMSRRKNHKGRVVPERWVFGGYDTSDKIGFLRFVEDRSAATLLPIIQQVVLPGTTIHSDQWAAYNDITNIPVVPPYVHASINHSENFVDPVTGVHTQHVECMWKNAKRKFKAMLGVQSTMLPSHLDEFMWRQRYGATHDDALNNILLHISQWYIVP